MSTVTTVAALTAYGPQGLVLAQSWDGGKTWKQTDAGKAMHRDTNTKPRPFTRRVIAAVNAYTPSVARRVETPFSIMGNEGIIAGWAPAMEIAAYGPDSVECVLVPGTLPGEELEELRRVAKTLILDIDAPQHWEAERREAMVQTLPLFDAVIVPTELLAGRLRPYHDHVFVGPHTLRPELWLGVQDHVPGPVVCAIPGILDDVMTPVVAELKVRYQDRVRWVEYNWDMMPTDEPGFYQGIDVVVMPPPPDRYQACLGPLLPAMMGKCTIVADRTWTAIQHRETGLVLAKHGSMVWLQELNRIFQDRRSRIRIGRAAKSWASRYTPQVKLNQLLLPYRVMVPEHAPVVYR